jgi:hypothetical protein
MIATGGYPWIVTPLGRRDAYMGAMGAMGAIKEARVRQNISPVADFLAQLVEE